VIGREFSLSTNSVLRSKIGHNEISPKTKEQVKPKRKISG